MLGVDQDPQALQKVDVAHTLDFDWGTFTVSDGVYDLIDFVPFRPVVGQWEHRNGGPGTPPEPDHSAVPQVHARLVTGNEIDTPVKKPLDIDTYKAVGDGAIYLTLALSNNKNQMLFELVEEHLKNPYKVKGLPPAARLKYPEREEDLEVFFDGQMQPIVSHAVTTPLRYGVIGAYGAYAAKYLREHRRQTHDEEQIKANRTLRNCFYLGVGLVYATANLVYPELSGIDAGLPVPLAAAGIAAYEFKYKRPREKADNATIKPVTYADAHVVARKVTHEVALAYSREYANERIKGSDKEKELS